jgi:hypothetical protein
MCTSRYYIHIYINGQAQHNVLNDNKFCFCLKLVGEGDILHNTDGLTYKFYYSRNTLRGNSLLL